MNMGRGSTDLALGPSSIHRWDVPTYLPTFLLLKKQNEAIAGSGGGSIPDKPDEGYRLLGKQH